LRPSSTPKNIAIAKKPLHKQLSRGGGRFTCRFCSRQFTRRFSLKRHTQIHTRKIEEIEPRFRHLAKEADLRCGQITVEAPPDRPRKVRRGRRKFCTYLCRGCPRKFDTYSKKRNHQKNCLNMKRDITLLAPEGVPTEGDDVVASICTG
jgi:transposase-like protein